MDRKRTGKKLSNKNWESLTASDARIARMKDGRTQLVYKPEHALNLATGAVIGVEAHPTDHGDMRTLGDTFEIMKASLEQVGRPPSRAERSACRDQWQNDMNFGKGVFFIDLLTPRSVASYLVGELVFVR
ncbi:MULTISPECIES: hypothetical protein [Pseudodesulfovibrio]|uniref:hypothetical protein n=1 Tax=Pseudodesulfovibrio TaxID=2035811 RepID=UPI0001BFA1A2|nr:MULTISPECIES: hypothetical protein [Pseudodesulfovibrio]MCG2733193.1 hypothetical protein [Pseudodesulfovibrio aespoeensis]